MDVGLVVLFASVSAARAQAQAAPEPSVFRLVAEHQPDLASAIAAKTAAGQRAIPGGVKAKLASAATGTFVEFDVPGVPTGYHLGTTPVATNDAGVIAGYVGSQGFVRTKDGTITPFDVPGDTNGTHPTGIDSGTTAGYYCDVNFLCHGFLRASAGVIATFDAPGAVAGTYPNGISPQGIVTGYYWDKALYRTRLPASAKWSVHHMRLFGRHEWDFSDECQCGWVCWSLCGRDLHHACDASINHGFLLATDGTITTLERLRASPWIPARLITGFCMSLN